MESRNYRLSQILRNLRLAQELSQNDIATRMNKDRQLISRLECGYMDCSLNMLIGYSKALNIPAWKILRYYLKENKDGSPRESTLGE